MPRRHADDPAGLPRFVTPVLAIAAGMTKHQIRQRVRSGAWAAVDRGLYDRQPNDAALRPWERQRETFVARATRVQRAVPGSVVSHRSAAVCLGLPLVEPLPQTIDLVVPDGTTSWAGRDHVVHAGALDTKAITSASGLSVTTAPRTFVDVARTSSFADALAVGDAALRSGLASKGDIDALIDAVPAGGRGRRRAVRAASTIDARRESPLESLSWARFIEWNLPLPRMQVTLMDGELFVATVDFLWDGLSVVGECDGALKYQQPIDLYREKRREDAIRALGHQVIRWGWADARSGTLLRRALTRALSPRRDRQLAS